MNKPISPTPKRQPSGLSFAIKSKNKKSTATHNAFSFFEIFTQ